MLIGKFGVASMLIFDKKHIIRDFKLLKVSDKYTYLYKSWHNEYWEFLDDHNCMAWKNTLIFMQLKTTCYSGKTVMYLLAINKNNVRSDLASADPYI